MQADLFSDEIALLKAHRDLAPKSSVLALRPFLDSNGILRVGGRLRHALLPFAVQHPILVASHPLLRLIIDQAHRKALHGGLKLTLSSLRREFWIIHARNVVKAVLFHCVVCTRKRAAIPSQLMGDLPAVRVSAPSRCFIHVGLDYAGPFLTRASPGRGIATRKSYIALFICLASRAIHLESLSDYSSTAFLGAFTRFVSRRGLPTSIYSDNGTTFVGADRELTTTFRSAINNPEFLNSVATERISWHFLPPAAPHFGGVWEAGVKSVKHHLRRVLSSHILTFEEFATLLCGIEACLNSRPIVPLRDTLDDYESLTPGHLLIGSAITAVPKPSLLDVQENYLSRWQRVRHMRERFWRLWSDDYINTLQQRQKWRKPQQLVKIGQLVLLRNPSLPPCKWEMGRVTYCHPGADGFVRVATIKTALSEYKRPITKNCILQVDCEATSA